MDRPGNQPNYNEAVYQICRTIPPGKVMTYGRIAALVQAPDGTDELAYVRIGARWVGYALANCPDDVPWHRVVNAKGGISLRPGHGPHVQRLLLAEEGIDFDEKDRIPLNQYLWKPE